MSGVRSIYRGATLKGYATPAGSPIYVDSDDNLLKYVPAGSGTTEIVLAQGGAENVVTTNVITASEGGKTFFLSLAAGFVSTLPAHSVTPVGATFRFIVLIAPSGGAYTIASNAADVNTMAGSINEAETDTTEDGPSSQGADLVTFVDGVALLGDWVEFTNTGAVWLVTGQTTADGATTIA